MLFWWLRGDLGFSSKGWNESAMSITVTTDVFCDKCHNWTHGQVGGRAMPKAARAKARGKGWKRLRIEGRTFDLCPTCATIAGVDKVLKP